MPVVGAPDAVRVLLVEDDEGIGAVLHAALGGDGYDVVWVRSVRAAVSTEGPLGAAVVDLTLPDGDGLDLIEWLVRRWPGMSVIAMTARLLDEDLGAAQRAGAVDFVAKPFSLTDLLVRLAAAVGGGR